jgi:hypothetical protein
VELVSAWPEIRVDVVAKLRALAAGLPHVVLAECVLEAPFERVWGIVGDLECGVPRFEANVSSARITAREGDRLVLVARHPLGPRARFDVLLQPGYCVMRARFADVGMAAVALPGGLRTRLAHYEGSRLLGRLAWPLLRRNIHADFAALRRLL